MYCIRLEHDGFMSQVDMALIQNKLRECQLRWLGHELCRLKEVIVHDSNEIGNTCRDVRRGRGN